MNDTARSRWNIKWAAMGEAVSKLASQGADWVHFDVMDGNFVPNITFGPGMCKALRPLTDLPIDVHLMVEHPCDWIEPFQKAGADILTIHVESSERHLHRALQSIHAAGMKAGVVLNPATPISACVHLLPECDLVLLMSVNPGFGGQSFIPETLSKILELKAEIEKRGLATLIEVDGGVNPDTAKQCIEAGANVLVAGSAVFHAPDPVEMIRTLRG